MLPAFDDDKLEDPIIVELCEKIKGYDEEIAELERQIQVAKNDYKSKNEDDPTL